MRAKICGLTNLSDAQYAATHGAFALGFNFCQTSKRYIEQDAAREIIQQLPKHCLKIGVLLDPQGIDIASCLTHIGLDFLQVYQICEASPALKKKMILSLTINDFSELPDDEVLCQYGYVLLDAPRVRGEPLGGTGRLSNWSIGIELAKKHRLILAGGLTPINVAQAIHHVHPFAVDVASGVQYPQGGLDRNLLNDFIKQVRNEA